MISGIVQGVFFRAHAQKTATELTLTGWVRNTSDGMVEAVAEGDEKPLEKFISWCRKGPPSARVDSVAVEWEDATNEFTGFNIRY